ncbi:MAG: SHOCT domain-containing protein [Beijerinckiaceae bacterium]
MMWNGPYGMMANWGGWGWFGPFHFIIPLLFLAFIVAAVVLLVPYATGWSDQPPRSARRPSGLEALEERYARGEIKREEFLEKKHDILG